MTTWKNILLEMLEFNNETINDIVSNTMSDQEMMKEFDDGYGGIEGIPFTVWTDGYVYFPICYDGAEWIGCVSRNPDGKPTSHQGGG